MINKILLGIDYGERKIGLAIKDKGIFQSRPIDGLKNTGDIPLKILQLCKQYNVEIIIIGYPIGIGGGSTRMSQKVDTFFSILRNSIPKNIEILLFDERHSTQQAKLFYEQNTKKQKSWVIYKDSLSAMMILNKYITDIYNEF